MSTLEYKKKLWNEIRILEEKIALLIDGVPQRVKEHLGEKMDMEETFDDVDVLLKKR